MSRLETSNMFSDVFASNASLNHSIGGDASRREVSAFAGDVSHVLDASSVGRLHRGGDSVLDTVSFIQDQQAEPAPIVAEEENGCAQPVSHLAPPGCRT
jgi:hypothetical protein